jgi:hypothetical protein
MLYVIGITKKRVEEWRVATGLPAAVVTPITHADAARGRRLELEEVVQLPRTFSEMPFRKARDLERALVPCFRRPSYAERIPIAMWPGGVG